MACLTSSKRAAYQADLDKVNELIAKALTSYERALENQDVEEYRFNSGEGSQMTKQADIKKLWANLESLYSRRDWLERRLNGKGVVNLNMRRKRYNGYY